MHIQLETEWERFVCEHVQSGRYPSASAVVREALCLLQEQEARMESSASELGTQIDEGIAALEEGEYVELEGAAIPQFFDEVNRRGEERLQEHRESRAQ